MHLDSPRINVTYRAEEEDEPRPRATTYTIFCKFKKTLSTQMLMDYLTTMDLSAVDQYGSKLELLQALSIFLNHHAKRPNNPAPIGSSNSLSEELGSGLRAVRSFFASVRPATNRILININATHSVFYQEGELSSLMDAYGVRPSLNKFLNKVRVRTTHLRPKKNKKGVEVPRVKTIYGLADYMRDSRLEHPPRVSRPGAGPQDVKFWLNEETPSASKTAAAAPGADPDEEGPPRKKVKVSGPAAGRYISVHNFFWKTYQIWTDLRYPVVNVGTSDNPSYLPVEVCVVMDGQACNTKLDSTQTQKMIKFAVRDPPFNAKSIVNDGFKLEGLTESNPVLVSNLSPSWM